MDAGLRDEAAARRSLPLLPVRTVFAASSGNFLAAVSVELVDPLLNVSLLSCLVGFSRRLKDGHVELVSFGLAAVQDCQVEGRVPVHPV